MIEFFDDEGVIGTIAYDDGELDADIVLQSVAQAWVAGGRDPADFEDAYVDWSNGYVRSRLIELDDESDTLIADALPFHLPGRHNQKNHGRRYNTPGDKSSGLNPGKRNPGPVDPAVGDEPPRGHREAPHAAGVPLTEDNVAALDYYTGLLGAGLINSQLRGLDGAEAFFATRPEEREKVDRSITEIRDAMRPLPESTELFRGTRLEQFPGVASLDDLPSLVGKTVHDKGFVSTSKELGPSYLGFGLEVNDNILMKINAPAGYPVADLEKLFNAKWGEREMLLDSDTTFVVGDAAIVEIAPGMFRWQVTLDVAP